MGIPYKGKYCICLCTHDKYELIEDIFDSVQEMSLRLGVNKDVLASRLAHALNGTNNSKNSTIVVGGHKHYVRLVDYYEVNKDECEDDDGLVED